MKTSSKTNPRSSLNYVMFAFLCLFWGSTWIAIKIGVETAPPLFFAATRFLAAGIILAIFTFLTGDLKTKHLKLLPTVLLPTILMISVNYGLVTWAMTRVPSGISAVVQLSMIPLSTTLFSILLGQTQATPSRWAGIGLGVTGLCVLFLPNARVDEAPLSIIGTLAIALSAACYGSGSVLLRAKNVACPPAVLSAIQSFSGGFMLLLVSFVLEPIHSEAWSKHMGLPALYSWAFLVVVGSVLAFTIYLTLLPRWGATRVTAYAFVCPIIALIEGALFTSERISAVEIAATLLLLGATWLSLKPERVKGKPRK